MIKLLIFWNNREDCERYYSKERGLSKEESIHDVDLCMIYGQLLSFDSYEAFLDFQEKYNIKV
jgi:hypothetical protein